MQFEGDPEQGGFEFEGDLDGAPVGEGVHVVVTSGNNGWDREHAVVSINLRFPSAVAS